MAEIYGTRYNDNDTYQWSWEPFPEYKRFPPLKGTSNDDNIYGSEGNDIINAGAGDDYVDGGFDDDGIGGGTGNDTLFGGYSGNDDLYGAAGNDTLNGGTDADTMYGGAGNDTLNGGTGVDTMYGGLDYDSYYVDTMSDIVTEYAGQGNDHVYSSVSTSYKWLPNNVENLTLTGTAYFGDGNDLYNFIHGNSSANSLWGYGGTDWLHGGDGNDYLYGGDGNDGLHGGLGKDYISGGGGEDSYLYTSISESPEGAGRDVIYGFEGGFMSGGDVIDLSHIDGDAGRTGHQELTGSQLTWFRGVLDVDVWNTGHSIDMQIEVAGLNDSDIDTTLSLI